MNRLPLVVAAFLAAAAFAPRSSSQEGDPLADQRALARQRYQRVLVELAQADTCELSVEQRAGRAEVLGSLGAYAARADFGTQADDPGARIPKFVDDHGRRCAMAELLHATGQDDLVAKVRETDNEAWIADLSEDGHLLEWLDRHGLSLFEAARIQGPSMARPPRIYDGPDDVVSRAPTSRGNAGSAGAAQPSSPGPSSASTGASPTQPSGAFTNTGNEGEWWLWWEFNKIEFLRPNRLVIDVEAGPEKRTLAWQVEFVRRAMLPSLLRTLEHKDARVRAAAAVALGRVGGAEAVDPLLGMLDDPNLEVRDMAVLGLGATGAREAQPRLVQLAREGRITGAKALGRRGRALAIVALGLGRRAGFDESADQEVIEIAGSRSPADAEAIGVAAMTYAVLSPSSELTALALEFAKDKGEPMPVRCRAVEALRFRGDTATLSALQRMASGSRLELRRSAALVLGELDHPLAPAASMTAHDLERDPLARAFLLISLGRQGGANVRDYLIDALQHGPGFERPWAALALGLIARAGRDDVATAALRSGVAREGRVEDRGAYWLALGIARDERALGLLRDALWESTDARSRMYAAQALAMLRGDEAHAALQERLEVERSSLARSQIALALGVLGEHGDVATISRVLASVSAPELQGQVAAAMAFHGSGEALHALGQLLTGKRVDSETRAASIDALGMMLGRASALSLGESSRSSNFTLFDDWLTEALATTL